MKLELGIIFNFVECVLYTFSLLKKEFVFRCLEVQPCLERGLLPGGNSSRGSWIKLSSCKHSHMSRVRRAEFVLFGPMCQTLTWHTRWTVQVYKVYLCVERTGRILKRIALWKKALKSVGFFCGGIVRSAPIIFCHWLPDELVKSQDVAWCTPPPTPLPPNDSCVFGLCAWYDCWSASLSQVHVSFFQTDFTLIMPLIITFSYSVLSAGVCPIPSWLEANHSLFHRPSYLPK